VFVTAHDVTPEWHIRMQAAFQEHTDSAISKTCNFPQHATEDDVRHIYQQAYALGCKGVTVYRDGSREGQVLSTGKTAKKVEAGVGAGDPATAEQTDTLRRQVADLKSTIAELEAELGLTKKKLHEVESENLQRRAKRSRPELLKGTTRRIETPLGTLYVTITEDDLGQPFEMFMSLGKAGGALMADVEAIGRLISLGLRSGIPIGEIHRQLRMISSDRAVGLGPNKVLSVPDAVGIAVERWMQGKQGLQQDLLEAAASDTDVATPAQRGPVAGPEGAMFEFQHVEPEQFAGACPDCGSQLEFAEGCVKCHVCGYSECG
jgi:ribonucleoside-diphosphate reductase alpha chain